ncbi:MAG: DUF1501 domain-containing protein [Sphingomonas sp.]|nr:DUF1501 domain-containing protein [Sphingomonas sp.]RZV48192.1 MAG: DUF1501 domain-containing protein [Sphingomonadaceae bacterium]
MFNRRTILKSGAVGLGAFAVPGLAVAGSANADTHKRFVFILQRGAADGLATLAPVTDPRWTALRREQGEAAMAGHKVDGNFRLHEAMTNVAALSDAGQALFIPAVATPYRDRSHFDAQNVIETGGAKAYQLKDGWLNRTVGLLGGRGLALAPTVPLALRGDVPVASYAPSRLPDASYDLMSRIGSLYAEDAQLGPLWAEAQMAREMAGDASAARNGAALGELAARMLAGPDGAKVLMIESDGWDTHFAQPGRLNGQLGQIDSLIGALQAGLGAEWTDTLVMVATEFGRTAALNGTNGTDHGTGALAMLLGGGVRGGRVGGNWPGLSRLYQDRDVLPTTGFDALATTAIGQHFDLDPRRVGSILFPETAPLALNGTLVG